MTSANLPTTQPLVSAGGDDDLAHNTVPLNNDDPALPDLPPMQFNAPLSLSAKVNSRNKQDVIFMRDRSTSMAGHKVDMLNAATMSSVSELAVPENKDAFLVSIGDFNHEAEERCFSQSANGLTIPVAKADGFTDFGAALELTLDMLERFKTRPNPDGYRFLQPQVLFLSDGQSNVSTDLIRQVHELAQVWSIAYGADADQETLARIASDGEVHVVNDQGAELRRFLAEVGKTIAQDFANAR